MGDEPADALAALWPRSLADLAVVGACAFFGFTVPVALFDSTVLFVPPDVHVDGFRLLMTLGWARGSSCARSGPGRRGLGRSGCTRRRKPSRSSSRSGGLSPSTATRRYTAPHFTTTHGKLGLLTIVLTVMSPTIGAVAFKRLGLLDAVPEQARPLVKAVHPAGSVLFTWCAGALATTSPQLPHPAVDQGSLTSA